MDKFAAIVLSAGVGSRMKSDIPKQYMDLAGKPVIYYSLKAFEDAGFSSIVLVCGKDDIEYCQEKIVKKHKLKNVTANVPGGKERYHSVYEGLKAIGTSDYVFIHDGARPFIDIETIKKTIELTKENNPDLKKQKLTLEDAKRKAQNKWNKFLPNMSASANLSNGHDFAGSSNWDWRASAGANLSFSFALPSTIQQTQLNYLIEQANYQKLESQTISSVSTTFYSLIAEQQNIQILKESQNLAKKTIKRGKSDTS